MNKAQTLADKIFKWPGYAFTDGRVAEEIDALVCAAVEQERERIKAIVQQIKTAAELDRDIECRDVIRYAEDRDAAACWVDCAAQILYEI